MEGAEPVAEVREIGTVQRVEHPEQKAVSEPSDPGDIHRTATGDEPGTLDDDGRGLRRLAERGDLDVLHRKISNAPAADAPEASAFAAETEALMKALATADSFHPSPRVAQAFAAIRERIPFMHRDRAMDGDIWTICELVHVLD